MTSAPADLCRRVVHLRIECAIDARAQNQCELARSKRLREIRWVKIEKAGEIRRPFVLLCTTSKHYLRFLAAFFAPPRFLLADLRPDFFVADFFFLVAMIHSPL